MWSLDTDREGVLRILQDGGRAVGEARTSQRGGLEEQIHEGGVRLLWRKAEGIGGPAGGQ